MQCPVCSYRNSDADLCCSLCRTVFPAEVVDERLAALKDAEAAARSASRSSTERSPRPATDGLARPGTDRIAKPPRPSTDRLARVAADAIRQPVAPPATTVVELVARAKAEEFRKDLVRTGIRLWRLVRHAGVCFVVLLLACLFREGVFTTTSELIAGIDVRSLSSIIGFSLIMGIPTGLLVSLRGAGRFRGFAIATALFAIEPCLLQRFATLPDGMQFAPWSLLDLVVAVLAGFVVGLYAEIDR